jgi:5-methylcytosine-specific restriction endonuclease McrA
MREMLAQAGLAAWAHILPDQPAVPSSLRRLPTHTTAAAEPNPTIDRAPIVSTKEAPSQPETIAVPRALRLLEVAALAPERYKVQFTVDGDTHDRLRRAQDVMRHACPNGDIAIIFSRALVLLVDHLEKTKFAAAKRPRSAPLEAVPGSRHIPAAVRRSVWRRDEARCAFVGARGGCTEHGFLEFHHVVPFAEGGRRVPCPSAPSWSCWRSRSTCPRPHTIHPSGRVLHAGEGSKRFQWQNCRQFAPV